MINIIKHLDRADRQKLKMLEIKAELNKAGFRLGVKNASYIELIVNLRPELNNTTGRNRIKNVWGLRQTDEKILSSFEILLNNIPNE